MRKKSVLLIMADFMGMNNLMEQELSKEYNVTGVYYVFDAFRYDSLKQRIYNVVRKVFLRDKEHKKQLIIEYRNKKVLKSLSELKSDEYDYALVLNVEYFTRATLNLIKSKSNKMIAYQWDGLSRSPSIYSKVNVFDRFYAFDPIDANVKEIEFKSNFYFDINFKEENRNGAAFYIGNYKAERNVLLSEIASSLRLSGIEVDFRLYSKNNKFKTNQNVQLITAALEYREVLEITFRSRYIVDLKLEEHSGLSFRFFEAMKYERKIITTNGAVKKYDFYKPSNVFVFGEDKLSDLKEFLHTDYVSLPKEITSKYEFINWARGVFEG